MKVSLSVGQQSLKIINSLSSSLDNVEFYSFPSIPNMIQQAVNTYTTFDRIIISTAIIPEDVAESDLKALKDYIISKSSGTEIILVLPNSYHGSIEKVFLELFNSPMYTPVRFGKVSVDTLVESVKSDIRSLRDKYYVSDSVSDSTIVSNRVGEVTKEEPPKKEKSGFFSKFKGGKSKEPVKNVKPVSESGQSGEMASYPMNNGVIGNSDNSPRESGESVSEPEKIFRSTELNSSSEVGNKISEIGGEYLYDRKTNLGDTTIFSGEESLNIGEYGVNHVDTGYLDEDSEEEVRRHLASRNQNNESDSSKNTESIKDVDNSIVLHGNSFYQDNYEYKKKPSSMYNSAESASSHIDLILSGDRRATQMIVDEAINMADNGYKVLIVDLDTESNNLLSFIDTEKFYQNGCARGISLLRTYNEDGVDIISNGYGVSISEKEVSVFLRSKLIQNYNIVFIDCPMGSLGLISYDMVKHCNILIVTGSGLEDIISNSIKLTDRSVVSLNMERYIMETANVEVVGKLSKSDYDYLKSNILLVNGNWLDKLQIS